MADLGEQLQSAEGTIQIVLVVAGLGILAYILYQIQSAGKSAAGAVDDLLQSIGIKTSSGGSAQPSQVPGNATVGQSAGGYDKMGASGQMWSCSGPAGSSSDMCTPVSCDSNGNCTATGAAVPAATAN